MARLPDLEIVARAHGLKIGSIVDLIHHRSRTERLIERVAERPLMTPAGAFRLVVYRDKPLAKLAELDLQKTSDDELVRYQTHKNEWFSRHARRILQERKSAGKLGNSVIPQLTRMLAVCGVATGVAGTTACPSGVEHLVSHRPAALWGARSHACAADQR